MQKVIGVTELQRNFRFVFDEVTKGNTPYVLTRSSRPEAVLIPYEDFLRFQAQEEQLVVAQVAGQLGAGPGGPTTPDAGVAAGEEMRQIVNLLASQPAPQAILDIRPSAAFQARVSTLLARNKERTLSRQEEAELERCLMLEHLVRLAKARAYQQLNLAS